MLAAPDAPPMEVAIVYTDEAIASAADGGYGIALLPKHAFRVCIHSEHAFSSLVSCQTGLTTTTLS